MRHVLATLLCATLAGCAAPSDSGGGRALPPTVAQPSLDETGWRLLAVEGETVSRAGAGTTLTFGDSGARGTGPCNIYGSDIEIDGDRLAFGPIEATERACFPETRNLAEGAYFAALEQTARYESDGSTLTLFDLTGTELLRFERQQAVDTALIGTQWSLGDLEGTPAFGLAFLSFDANGELRGQGPCNSYAGDYRLGPQNGIEIMANATTRCWCEDLAREQQYLDALSRTETWRIDGERLLLEAGDATLLILERARSAPEALRGCGG